MLNNSRYLNEVKADAGFAFKLYLLYLVSFFLHLPERIKILGVVRFDFLLVGLICYLILSSKVTEVKKLDNASKYLLAIFLYAIFTLPVVEWPGSVLKFGLVEFIKGAIFYFFTINLITTESRLKSLIYTFIACNVVRVLEPLFLHVTTGYLGSETYIGGGDFAGRLAGAPSDTINPNGLAFVIATVLPFLHYVVSQINRKMFFIYLCLLPILMYVMVLTLSRSGILAVGIIAFGVWVKSKHKFLLIVIGLLGIAVIFGNLTPIEKDRYLSIVSVDARQSASAEGRIDGWIRDFKVALDKPIIGHGLGTSKEANWNIAGEPQVSHILWAEIWQEIGLIGLVLFIFYLIAVIKNFGAASTVVKALNKNEFLYKSLQAMQVWFLMNMLFSLASYGLKSYEWYFFGGLSVVVYNLACRKKDTGEKTKVEFLRSTYKQSEKFPSVRNVNEYKNREP